MTGMHRHIAVASVAALTLVLVALTLVLAAPAAAQQEAEEGEQSELDDRAARVTYEAGREAFAGGDYETALERFQQAYRLSPRPTLLYLVAQTYDRLRRDEEALTALQQYIEERPDAPNREEIEARITVLQAAVDERHASEEAQRATEAEADRARTEAVATPEPAPTPEPASRPPLHMGIFIATLGAAVGAGGVAVWTGLETLSLHDDYEAATELDAARAAYDDGTSYELITNILIFSASGLAGLSVIFAILTDWEDGGGEDTASRARPYFVAGPGGGVVGAEGRY